MSIAIQPFQLLGWEIAGSHFTPAERDGKISAESLTWEQSSTIFKARQEFMSVKRTWDAVSPVQRYTATQAAPFAIHCKHPTSPFTLLFGYANYESCTACKDDYGTTMPHSFYAATLLTCATHSAYAKSCLECSMLYGVDASKAIHSYQAEDVPWASAALACQNLHAELATLAAETSL